MANRQIVSFRCTREMDKRITRVMEERGLDCTSVMKLALYWLSVYMSRVDVRKMDMHQVVAEMEALAPCRFPSFNTFAAERRLPLKPRRRRARLKG